jgi:hypothetical protein
VGDWDTVVLTAVGCDLTRHCMLTMMLAAVLRHLPCAGALLEAGKTCPCQERTENQHAYTHYPQAMFLLSFHRIFFFLSSSRVRVNPCILPYSEETGRHDLTTRGGDCLEQELRMHC